MRFVPYNSSKTQYANPHENILIDDDLKKLEETGTKKVVFQFSLIKI